MTDAEIQEFVTRFAAAWAARDGNAFLDLWHPEGLLHTPLVNRPVAGSELCRRPWASRGVNIIIEWQAPRLVNSARFSWRGVDRFRTNTGKIIEARVYCDN